MQLFMLISIPVEDFINLNIVKMAIDQQLKLLVVYRNNKETSMSSII